VKILRVEYKLKIPAADWSSIGKTFAHGTVFTQAYKQHNKE